ncbi:hypothetical protein [Streptomyces atacamensis]|uniref:hypothetical protein n=1 Tax=Streptomyces atacamensis TaxID=531966 RepID=UPI00399D15CC
MLVVRSDTPLGAEESARQRTAELTTAAAESFTDGKAGAGIGQGQAAKQAVEPIDREPRGIPLPGSSYLAPDRRTSPGTTATRILRHLPLPTVVVPHTDGEQR